MKKRWEKKGPTQKERVQQLLEVLEEGVVNFVPSPETFKALLEMKALMPSYSFRNILVAKAQLESVSFIAGYKHWEKLGRHVTKGQKAIRIFAPRFKLFQDEDDPEKQETKMAGFITVPVFDVSQTEGDPLPIDKIKIELEGDCPEAREIISLAEEIAEKDNCPITYGFTGSANGYYRPGDHSITVSNQLPINHRCKTLVHELVHSKVDRIESKHKASKKEKEVVAEGTAFVVCSYFGLDTSEYSFNYVKGWGGEDNPILRYGERISSISGQIIQEFDFTKGNRVNLNKKSKDVQTKIA